MAPEIAEGKSATVQSDVYSLGITFFELLTGKLPFTDNSAVNIAMKHISEQFINIVNYLLKVRIQKFWSLKIE